MPKRSVIGKSTSATLDFAAVAAKMARAYKEIDSTYSNRCMMAAIKANKWAKENPAVVYKNPEDIVTGEYGDSNFSQEFYWAAAELYLTTEQDSYLEDLKTYKVDFSFEPG